jgi:glycosyltransferase involved in cell wall biosynthesis
MVHSNLLVRLSRLLWWTPVVFGTIHSTHEGGRSRDVAYRWTERLADCTTAVSQSGVEMHLARGGDAGKLELVPNGIDLDRFAPDPGRRAALRDELGVGDDRFVWLCVARFDLPKDHPTLLAAMAELPANAELWLVGQGRLQGEVEAGIARLQLGDRVRLLGVRSDVPELLCAADGFVLSSRSEAMPITLLEAGAAAVPVVSSDVGAVRDLVDDGVSGHVVPAADVGALRDGMAAVMALCEAEHAAMGAAGRAWVEARYSLAAVVERWEELYREALARAAGRRFPPAAWAWRRRAARLSAP